MEAEFKLCAWDTRRSMHLIAVDGKSRAENKRNGALRAWPNLRLAVGGWCAGTVQRDRNAVHSHPHTQNKEQQ